jgi:hypothetical protein
MNNANVAGWLFTGIGMAVLIGLAIRAERRLRQNGPVESRERMLDREVKALRAEVKDLKTTVETLTKQLVSAFEKIRLLEAGQISLPTASDKFHLPELLVLFGPNQAITARDKSGLHQEGIDFESRNPATRANIIEELVARREDRRKLRWLHISSDADARGVLLAKEDGTPDIVEAEWWRDHITEAEVIFVAACKGTRIATQLAALCEWLVYFRESVDNNDAGAFAGCFWGEVVCGIPVEAAYAKARQRVPAVRDFVALRHRGN